MRGRSALLALAALVVLAFVAAITLLPRGGAPPSPAASPGPTVAAAISPGATAAGTAAASPSADASPTGAAALEGRFGIVTSRPRSDGTGGEYVVRSEADTRAIATLAMGFANSACPCGAEFAVSPDGRRLAFWTPGETGANRLELWDATRPERTTTALTSPSGEVGTRVAWSSDGAGLLLAFDSVERTPAGHTGGWPVASVLRTLVLSDGVASPALTEVARVSSSSGRIFAPLAWDRAARAIGALESEGMSRPLAFLFIRDGHASRTALENPLHRVSGTPDGRVAMDLARPPHRILAWRDDPARATELRPDGDQVLSFHGWVPGSTRVIVSASGAAGPLSPSTLFLWDVATGQRTLIPNASRGTGTIVGRVGGTVLYLNASQSVATVLDVASGRREPLPSLGNSEHVLASVILR